jgi:hypothetical protein
MARRSTDDQQPSKTVKLDFDADVFESSDDELQSTQPLDVAMWIGRSSKLEDLCNDLMCHIGTFMSPSIGALASVNKEIWKRLRTYISYWKDTAEAMRQTMAGRARLQMSITSILQRFPGTLIVWPVDLETQFLFTSCERIEANTREAKARQDSVDALARADRAVTEASAFQAECTRLGIVYQNKQKRKVLADTLKTVTERLAANECNLIFVGNAPKPNGEQVTIVEMFTRAITSAFDTKFAREVTAAYNATKRLE